MGLLGMTAAEYLAEAEYYKTHAETYEGVAKQNAKVPYAVIAQIAADRASEAKYRALAAALEKKGR